MLSLIRRTRSSRKAIRAPSCLQWHPECIAASHFVPQLGYIESLQEQHFSSQSCSAPTRVIAELVTSVNERGDRRTRQSRRQDGRTRWRRSGRWKGRWTWRWRRWYIRARVEPDGRDWVQSRHGRGTRQRRSQTFPRGSTRSATAVSTTGWRQSHVLMGAEPMLACPRPAVLLLEPRNDLNSRRRSCRKRHCRTLRTQR